MRQPTRIPRPFLIACLILLATNAVGKSVYVNDTLRVGLRPEPSTAVAPIGVVTTGMKLELLGEEGDYVQVQTGKGQSGWIKKMYIVDSPTAGIRLQAIEKKQAALKARIRELEEANKVLATANHTLNQKVDTLTDERSRWQLEQARLQVSTAGKGASHRWLWWLIGVLVTAAAGFFSGITWYRHTTARRLGGLRV